MRWSVLAPILALALGLLAPFAGGQAAPATVNVLVYHVDDALEGPEPPGELRESGALRLPSTAFDRILATDPSRLADPTSVIGHLDQMRAILLARDAPGASATLRLDARVEGGRILANVTATGVAPPNATLRAVVFEDPVRLEGASGIDVHIAVARAAADPQAIDVAGGDTSAEWDVALEPGWDASRIGIVAFLESDGEVAQSVSWRAGQASPVAQQRKAVLIEHATGAWCEPCAPADRALSILVARYAEGESQSPSASYLRTPTWATLGGAALGCVLVAAALRRRP